MTAVTPANYTVQAIEAEAREYIGISSNSILPSSTIEQEINYFYTANIPESIKLDQLRTVYTIYTLPYVDRYPVDVNQYQSFREPVLIDGGIRMTFYKDRSQFYGWWPNVPTYIQPASGDGTTQIFNFYVPTSPQAPVGRTTFVCSVPDTTGNQLICADDGGNQQLVGNLLLVIRNSVGDLVPPFPPLSPLALNPLPDPPYNNIVGQINYVTGQVNITWPTAPAANQLLQVQYFQASVARPQSLLYWNNEIVIRPIPMLTHKITMEAYMTPVQMLNSTNSPFLNNFKKYIALGVAINILDRIGDNDRKMQLISPFEAAEGRVLERQANEEIGQSNTTIFNQQGPYASQQYPYGGYWY